MHRLLAAAAFSLICVASLAAEEAPTEEAALRATRLFGEALERGDVSGLRALLPEHGKIQLRLQRLGPEQGYFSPSQVEALLQDFLDRGSVRAFEPQRLEHQPQRYALAHARAVVVDAAGHSVRVELRLAFQPEGGSWVLREIREAPS